jgi:hypothetical protein
MRAMILLGVIGLLAALAGPAAAQKQGKLSDKEMKRAQELIDQLDARKFTDRERAMKELAGLGERALALLEKAARRPASLEAQRRLTYLIGKAREEESRRFAPIIQRLGDPLFQERQAAMAELEKIGRPALRYLHAAKRGQDPETVRRADLLINRILQRAK